MQVKAIRKALPVVSADGFFDDRDHLGGQAPVVSVAPVVPLTAFELVMTLFCGTPVGLEYDELAEMSDDEVRRYVGYVITFNGMSAVQRAAQVELADTPADPDERTFLALCEARCASAFGVTVRLAARSRAASRSIGARRTLVKVAA